MPRSFIITLLTIFVLVLGCDRPSSSRSSATPPEEMQLIPGATYRMGSDLEELDKIRAATGLHTTGPLMFEVPSLNVTVSDFFMDTWDVTNQQYSQFVEAVPSWRKEHADPTLHNGRYLEHWVEGSPPDGLFDHPVTFVTWQAAVEYCEWRGRRLPTEIEYEWAAQDGITRIEYPWGNSPPGNDVVNWGGSAIRATVPVGSYPPNARGLYDMSGNVWRFTSDPWLGSYAEMSAGSADSEVSAADPSIRRVVRGGSWGANAANLRVRYRDSHRPFDAREMVGFRCAKSIGAE